MANIMIPEKFGQVSTKFAGVAVDNDLAAGVQAGFGLIGYKGKVWSIRYRGDEQQLLRDDGDGPRNSIEIVILKAAPYISKIWYEKGYVEGSTAAPDCFSPNGVVPDPQSTKKQSNACASCPQNVWGSKITEAGKKGKACSDSKRLAVVPVGDIMNETFGGPMLLRVPAASLQDLATFGNKMQNLGYPYYAIATRVAFDANEAYPKFILSAIRPLTDEEADQVLALQSSAEVSRVLAEGTEHQTAEAPVTTADVANAFEQPPVTSKGNDDAAVKAAAAAATKAANEKAAKELSDKAVAKARAEKAAAEKAAKEAAEKAAAAKAAAETKPKSMGGFGATKPVTTTTEAKPNISTGGPRKPPEIPDDEDETGSEEVEASAEEEVVEDEEGTGSDFEKSLDDQLAELLKAD
jgi:hypothetical protein